MSAPNTTNQCLIKTNVANISLNKFKELFRLFNSRNLIQITYILYTSILIYLKCERIHRPLQVVEVQPQILQV